jgi:hypothetical protein
MRLRCHVICGKPPCFYPAGSEIPETVTLPGCARRYLITEAEADPPKIRSGRSTVELIKLVATRLAEFFQRVLDFTKSCSVIFLGCHTGAPVRCNDLVDRMRCSLKYIF